MNASSNFATVTFVTVFKMCRYRVNTVLHLDMFFQGIIEPVQAFKRSGRGAIGAYGSERPGAEDLVSDSTRVA